MKSRTLKKANKNCYSCSIEAALHIIGNKWKGAILCYLLDDKKRFNELRRLIPNVSPRMLTLQLRELENVKIIQRTVYPEIPPRVEYALTEFGQTLRPVLCSLKEWGNQAITYLKLDE